MIRKKVFDSAFCPFSSLKCYNLSWSITKMRRVTTMGIISDFLPVIMGIRRVGKDIPYGFCLLGTVPEGVPVCPI